MSDDRILVHFDKPPVTEVVAAVAFEPLAALTTAHIGEFWSRNLQGAFPQVEERPPYDPPIESLGGRPSPGQISFTISPGPPPFRLWFKSAEGQELLQIQKNWFACNWRKVRSDDEYGHWPPRREAFLNWYSKLNEFVDSHDIGPLRATQCEVTYVNHIVPGNSFTRPGEFDQVFNMISHVSGFLPQPEEFQFRTSYVMELNGDPIGRLHASADPVISRREKQPAISLNLTARGAPLGDGTEGIVAFLDRGREWVVRGFEAITTDTMHREWGRTQ